MAGPGAWRSLGFFLVGLSGIGAAVVLVGGLRLNHGPARLHYQPCIANLDTSGFMLVQSTLRPWTPDASLEDVGSAWRGLAARKIGVIERLLAAHELDLKHATYALLSKARLHLHDGEPDKAYEALLAARADAENSTELAEELLYTIIYFQGVTALRRGENDNCVLCRGESSCILPIAPAAVHTKATGSRLAIRHFTEYLQQFPDDLDVRWLLNLAHMTLAEFPQQVDPDFLITIDPFLKSEFDIGKFRDVGHLVGLNHLNTGGGAIMEDFDNDGLLDVVITPWDYQQSMRFYRNKGDGTFEDR
ncbi:MAG TPA: VCBS repeat-containing protein, partial [Gemmataceae bacterium]|nr:VCBS repeat-containing protein [Gemmataceae bacterium]